MGFYYPGMKRLAGEVNETSRPSKDLSYINEDIPGSSVIRKLQAYTDHIEDDLAREFEKKKNRN